MNSKLSKAKNRKLHKIKNNSKSLTAYYYTNESKNKSLSMNYTNSISSYQNNSSLQKIIKRKYSNQYIQDLQKQHSVQFLIKQKIFF